MLEIMESRVLAILLSTRFWYIVAFKTEKAAGIIATQFRLPCKWNKRKCSVQRKLCPIAQIFLFLTCPTSPCCFLRKFKIQKDCGSIVLIKKGFGAS